MSSRGADAIDGPRHLYPECRAVESQLAQVSKLATCAHRKLRDRVFVIVLRIYWPHDKISCQWMPPRVVEPGYAGRMYFLAPNGNIIQLTVGPLSQTK